MKRPHYLLLPLLLSACATPRQTFERRLDEAISRHRARVGVAVRTPGGETIVREDSLLPMLSVFKFPVALAVLDKAAKEGIPLGQPLAVGPEWLDPDTWSPLRDSLPGTGGIVALADLLRYSVSRSDNIACDRLLEFTGGPSAVQAYVRSLGIDGIRIRASERTMHLAIENQRLNAARPSALCELFERFVEGALLPPDHQALLRHLLETAATGTDKLRAGLPARTALGHKTGSSDRTTEGIRIAENDAGYAVLPDGRFGFIVVFVTDSHEDDAANAALIARISRAAYTCFTEEKR